MQADASQVGIPLLAFDPVAADQGSNWFYGSLPREAVCTENLTPWLKLLPCQGKQGLTQLMHRPTLYGASFHAMKVHLIVHDDSQTESCPADLASNGSCPSDAPNISANNQHQPQEDMEANTDSGPAATLTQTLTLVLRPQQLHTDDQTKRAFSQLGKIVRPDLDLQSLFNTAGVGACPKASHTHIYLHLSQSLLNDPLLLNSTAGMPFVGNKLYSITPAPHAVMTSSGGGFAMWNVTAQQQTGQHDAPAQQCLQPSLTWHQQPEHWTAEIPPVQVRATLCTVMSLLPQCMAHCRLS